MDNSAQNNSQNTPSVSQAQDTASAVNTPQPSSPPQPTTQQVTQTPVVSPQSAGSVQKEHEFVTPSQVTPEQEPFIQASESEPKLHPEVKEAGVETVAPYPQLTAEHTNVGISHVKEATPVPTEPSGAIQFPMTEEKAEEVVKTNKNASNSIVWLANLIITQFKKMKGKNLPTGIE